ncbi:MAG: hypothetical protein HFJ80_03005 [Clostridiales bacterium]|nr:hypothetical protein [Clostridiales bacterium]
MLCQNCGKSPATTHVKRNINGKTAEWHLCADCAAKQGIGAGFGQGLVPVLGGLGFELGDFWGSLFAEPAAREQKDAERCPGCGSSFNDIAQSGKVGCAQCYTTFYDRLLPSVQRIHGKTRHVGKIPVRMTGNETPEDSGGTVAAVKRAAREQELKVLRQELDACVARQEYEKCAGLRDRIRELEQDEEGAGEKTKEEGRHAGE